MEDARALQHDLQLLELWEEKWKMSFNVDKCMVVSVTLKRTPVHANYTLHGKKLTVVECAKYLGVSIDSKLCFNQNVDNVCKKANSVLGFVRRNFKNCSRKIKENLYFTYVKPVLEYAAAAWAPHSRHSINKMEFIQRSAARFVMNNYFQTSSV